MERILKTIPFHATGLAIFPVLVLASANTDTASLRTIAAPLLLFALIFAVFTALAGVLLRDRHRGGLLALLGVAVFYGYRSVSKLYLPAMEQVWPAIARERFLLAGMMVLVAIGVVLLWRSRRDFSRATPVLNRLALVFVAVPLAWIAVGTVQNLRLQGRGNAFSRETHAALETLDPAASLETPGPARRPSVYYLIFDEYGRHDLLQEIFGIDNGPFLQELEKRGFYVADHSCSNYPRTLHSLVSTFHMAYLDPLAQSIGEGSEDIRPLHHLLLHNPVWDAFESMGYETVAFQTGFDWADFTRADRFERYTDSPIQTDFTRRLVGMTALDVLRARAEADQPEEDWHRVRVTHALTRLGEIARDPDPKFVFGHVLCPHDPFLFSLEGENPATEYRWDSERAKKLREEGLRDPQVVAGYAAQLPYLNQRILETVDAILRNSPTPPIVVMQGDHGSGSKLHPTDPERSDLEERFAIFNAWYLPDARADALHPTITSVNTFRFLFREYFGADLELLPDHCWFSSFVEPYRFQDVDERVRH